jgi:hypothetical protein
MARIFHLLYRRIPFCGASEGSNTDYAHACRLEIGDTDRLKICVKVSQARTRRMFFGYGKNWTTGGSLEKLVR